MVSLISKTLQGLVLVVLEIASHAMNAPHSKMVLLMVPRLGLVGNQRHGSLLFIISFLLWPESVVIQGILMALLSKIIYSDLNKRIEVILDKGIEVIFLTRD